ncbi:MAG TPA: MFS transporter, partial [Rhizomicrobium sp.]|jgi:PAT family beta-lactamase induction signal transducer AmpG|nr:MFS transporter [Rhizomicrobium sp.]
MKAAAPRRHSFKDYFNRRSLVMLALGFSSGLPFLLVGNTLGFWLRDEGTSLKAIGFLSWVGIAYSAQFAWAPLVDRVPLLKTLGQRRGWLLLAQIFVMAGLFAMAAVGTAHGLGLLGACALFVAFSAATQDIALAAWRIEIARDADELGLLTSANTLGFRVALLLTDSLILVAAQHIGWPAAYSLCGVLMAVGITATLLAPEPVKAEAVIAENEMERPLWTGRGFFDAVAGPFIVFFKAHGSAAILMLAAIGFYRLPDFVRGPMTNPFFHDIGMSKDMVGLSRATVGLATAFLGVAAGGFFSMRLGFLRTLLLGGALQALGIAAHALLTITSTLPVFLAVMGLDDFSLSFAGMALVAYMSSLTSPGYTATQFALLSSAYALLGKFLKGPSGVVVEALTPHFGLMNAYAFFFVGCGALGVPALILFLVLARKPAPVTAS